MGFFDFFKNLFGGGKPKIKPEDLVIDITDSKITVNGKSVDIPCHLSLLEDMLGKPRKFVGKNSHINFTWDNLGMYCYTLGNNVVYCIAVKVNIGNFATKFYPKSTFKGSLTIFGEQWEEFMYEGENVEDFFRRRVLNGISVVSEYIDIEVLDKNGPHGAYEGVEIELKNYSTV